MKNFSTIEDNLITTKDALIESFIIQSGLPREHVVKLYEGYSLHGMDDSSIDNKFKSMLNVGLSTFTDSLNVLMDILKDSSKETINGLVMKLLEATSENNTVSFFKIIMYLLFMKDQTNFVRIAKDMNIDSKIAGFLEDKTTNLFESMGMNPDLEGKVPTILGLNDGCQIEDDIRFYGDLKNLLGRNNKRWGNNYHLDNVYSAICKYLDTEIDYLVNKNNITTVDANYADTLIRQLITGEINVMYREVNTLRPLISDLQTLNFDLMCLVMSFVKQHAELCRYISRKSFDEFLEAFTLLYGQISSSRKTSLVLVPYTKPGVEPCIEQTKRIEILENVYIDTNKYDIYLQPLKVVSVVDMLYIMKSCSFDFNLSLRPYFRNFITKSFEVIGKLEHIMLEAQKINKNKNGIL